MDRQRVSEIAHQGHPIAAPLAEGSVRGLLERALPAVGGRVLDLGCGRGAWLVRAAEGRPSVRGVGVDLDGEIVARGREDVERAGLGGRVVLHAGDVREFRSPDVYDLVLSVGATHAFGGLSATLDAASAYLAPGGSVLVGEGFWEREPQQATLDAGFGADEFHDLATTVERVVADGWIPVHGHVSSACEWDAYEWAWTGSLSRWALDHPDHPDSAEVLETARAHREGWLRGYRGTLGFVCLVLRRVEG
ncbi:class I SAM-dependent methyltransferase [Streptomyces pathocidini]|uniref:SAM-dependent methyltransferase n=1 Tax=Streptomyces pathocidini TaxID=1650571 RepID=UPI0033DB80AC